MNRRREEDEDDRSYSYGLLRVATLSRLEKWLKLRFELLYVDYYSK